MSTTTTRRSRTSRVLKWIAVAVCPLLAGLWLTSFWYVPYIRLYFGKGAHELYFQAESGKIYAHYRRHDPTRLPRHAPRSHYGLTIPGALCDWRRGPNIGATDVLWRSRHWALGSCTWPRGSVHYLLVSVWIPFLLLVLLTTFLRGRDWWREWRRIPPGHCQKCGYNLTGNVSGRCPECGTAIKDGGGTA